MSDRFRTPSGKVHLRRRSWYSGTPDERPAAPELNIMLCGQRRYLEEVSDDTELTCGTCLNAHKKREAAHAD